MKTSLTVPRRQLPPRMVHLVLPLLAAFLAFAVLVGGCGKLGSRLAEEPMAEMPPSEPTPEALPGEDYAAEAEVSYDKAEVRATGDTEAALSLIAAAEAASSRKVIKTAQVGLEVNDLKQAQKRVLDLVESKAGFVQSLSVTTTSEVRKDATIVARIPSIAFREVYEQVKQLGEVERDEVGGRDVTKQYADLEARIANKQVQEERLRDILKRRGKLSELLEVERELARVRGEIEQYQGELRYLKDQVQFSTITIYLYELGEAPVPEGPGWQLLYHLRGAWLSLLNLLQALVTGLVYAVIVPSPFWVLLIIVILALRARARRRRRALGLDDQ